MAKIGGALLQGDSKLWAGPLGVVQIGFEGYDLGKTGADSALSPDQDIKDIMYQQDGTKPADHVRTGQEYLLSVTLAEIKTGTLTRLMAGITTQNTSAADDDGTLDRDLYQSMLADEAGGLRIVAVDGDGIPSELDVDIMQFYDAIPIIDGELIQWGADTQRNLPVSFRIKWHKFAAGESTTKSGAFGYWGDATSEDVPAITWPDVDAPAIVSATAPSATSLVIVFDENIAFQTVFVAGHYMADVDGLLAAPTAGIVASATLTLTFGAATFASGDIITVDITAIAIEDTAATANTFEGQHSIDVINSVP